MEEKAVVLLQKSVLPITESCTTYYRILYYLLQKAVLPITESCTTYYRKLYYLLQKAVVPQNS